jgi:hypothetical protein
MNQFRVQVRIGPSDFTYVIMTANDIFSCQKLAEAQYGASNFLSICNHYG